MRQVVLLFAVFAASVLNAQPQQGYVKTLGQTNQQGVAYRYNGKNARTPLGNVTITYDANQRTTISNEQDGTFTLMLVGRKMGDRIGLVTVKKREMMVFNKQAVDEWSVRKEPLRLILCNADEFDRQKENLINIGRREAKKKYYRQKTDLEKQLSESKIKQQEYETLLDKAYEELERARKHMDEYAEMFARIDESEIDTLAQRAVELFNQGEVDAAIRLFEQGNYMEKLDKALKTSQQADQLKAIAEQAKEKATQDSLKALESLKAQIEAYKLNNEWQKAGELLKGLAGRLNTVQSMADYADFCQNQNNYAEAKSYMQKAIVLHKSLMQSDSNEWTLKMSDLSHFFGDILRENKEFEQSELQQQNALELLKSLAASSPGTYDKKLFEIHNSLGNLYENANQYLKAETDYLEAEKLAEKLQQIDSGLVQARVQNNLGLLYFRMAKYTQSETSYLKSKNYYQKRLDISSNDVAINNKNEYLFYNYAGTLYNLANLYKRVGRFDESKENFRLAVKYFTELSGRNRDAYDPLLAMIYVDFAVLYRMGNSYRKSIDMSLEALAKYRVLTSRNPLAFNPNLATTLSNLGITYTITEQYQEAEKYLSESLEIRKSLARKAPRIYNGQLATTYRQLGRVCSMTGRYEQAETFTMMAYELFKELSEKQQMITTLDDMGSLYTFQRKYEKSIEMYKQALDGYKDTDLTIKGNERDYANILQNMGLAYFYLHKYDDSVTALLEADSIMTDISHQNPEYYAEDVARIAYNLGRSLYMSGEFESALPYIQKAVDTYRWLEQQSSHKYSSLLAYTLVEQGLVNGKLHQDEKMEACYKEAIGIYIKQEKSISEQVAYCYSQLGAYYFTVHRYNDYEEMSKKALDVYKQLAQTNPSVYRPSVCQALGSMSYKFVFLKKYAEAEQYAREGLAVDSTRHWIAGNLAAALLFQGKYKEAETIYRKYKDELKDSFLDDFKKYVEAGVVPKKYEADVEKIKQLLNE